MANLQDLRIYLFLHVSENNDKNHKIVMREVTFGIWREEISLP